MLRLKVLFYWSVIATGYFFCSLWILFRTCPISIDGSGAVATFYWGSHLPTATLNEFLADAHIERRFLYPYWMAAALITFLGCGLTTWLVRFIRQQWHSRLLLLSAITNLLLLLLAGAVCDSGTAAGLWSGGRIYPPFYYPFPFIQVVIFTSLLSGVVAWVQDRLFPPMDPVRGALNPESPG